MNTINENNLEVRKELLRLSEENVLPASIGVMINSIVITVVFWNIADKIFLSFWLLCTIFIFFIRNINSRLYLKNIQTSSLYYLEKTFKQRTLVTSVILSIGFVVLLPDNKPYHQAFLTVIVTGISAAAMLSITYKKLARYYLLILMLPYIFSLLLLGEWMLNLISVLATLYLTMLIIFSKRYHKKVIQLITSNMQVKKSEKELKVSESNFTSIFQEVPISVFTYNKDLIITQANKSFSCLVSIPIDELIGLDLKLIPDQSIIPTLNAALSGKKGYYKGKYHTRASDEDLWIKMETVPMYEIQNKIKGGLTIIEDISSRVQADQKIHHQAFYDHLTGLANRLTLQDRLEQQIARLERHDIYGALLFIDIDHFKTINDSLGHHIGDILLQTFASRTFSITRKEDTLARLGGDEFVVLLSDLGKDIEKAKEYSFDVAQKIHELMKEPILVEEHSLLMTLSLGITLISKQDNNMNDVLIRADVAMYRAKELGRNTTCIFEE
ncbi:MAG: diguanylate cyclase (GGDEF)-like protein/PAS domain S-box-containing protein [Sulfurimonas sp.]|jgi:diguanylate cyclase (GGDEF)-like protein/PAS domain S-box-containing protein